MSRPAKKQSYNGFFMFRNHIKNEYRADGKRMSEDDLTKYVGELWESLDETIKEEWKNKAKEQKMISRNDTAVHVLSNVNRCPSPPSSVVSGPTSAAKFVGVRRLSKPHGTAKESVFLAWNELDLRENPEKKRENDRNSFANAFSWKYSGANAADLKKQKFYLLSSSLLYFLSDGQRVPAEIACVEFTLESGVTNSYCTPVKISDIVESEIKDKIKQISETSHRFLLQDLAVIGKSCQEISSRLIDMSHKREPSCGKIRFFILNSELNRTFSCLKFLLQNSDLEDRYKNMTVCDVATADDLVYSLFKYYAVDYPKQGSYPGAPSYDVIDLDQFNKLIGAENFRRVVCEVHEAYDDAHCCLSQLYLTVEMIRSSIERKKFNVEHLSEFASNVDALKLRYYESPPSSLRIQTDVDESVYPVDLGVEEIENEPKEEIENEEVVEENFLELTNVMEEMYVDSSSDSVPLSASSRVYDEKPTITAASSVEDTGRHPSCKKDMASGQETIFTPRYGDAFARAPDTLSVQHLLPSGRRGFGRGTRLTAEGELIDRLTWLKRLTS